MSRLAELNRERLERYAAGDTSVLDKLYLANRNFITACADKVCRRFRCKWLRDDLISAGTVAFLEQLSSYTPEGGATLTTYVYPYVVGAMRREMERNLGCSYLSKREFRDMRKAKTMHTFGYSFSEIAEELKISEVRVIEFLRGSLFYSSFDDEDNAAGQIRASISPVHRQAYLKICAELIEEEFRDLPFKERELLGGFYGVFGHGEQTLAALGGQFNMKENAALKARDKALHKLAERCREGKLGVWRRVYRAVMDVRGDE